MCKCNAGEVSSWGARPPFNGDCGLSQGWKQRLSIVSSRCGWEVEERTSTGALAISNGIVLTTFPSNLEQPQENGVVLPAFKLFLKFLIWIESESD